MVRDTQKQTKEMNSIIDDFSVLYITLFSYSLLII